LLNGSASGVFLEIAHRRRDGPVKRGVAICANSTPDRTSCTCQKVTAAAILDQDVCAFIRVNPEEIQDAWIASRLPLLAQTATTVMQLTPSADKLFSPTLRHFKNALSTYSLWMMDETKDPKGKHQALMSH